MKGTAVIRCQGPHCPEISEIHIDNIPVEDITEHILEANDRWYLGMYCPTHAPQARAADLADAERDKH